MGKDPAMIPELCLTPESTGSGNEESQEVTQETLKNKACVISTVVVSWHILIPRGSPGLLLSLLPATVHPGSQQVTAPVLGSLPPTGETRMDLLASSFSLPQAQMLQGIWEGEPRAKIF